jgi:hypothetical protein
MEYDELSKKILEITEPLEELQSASYASAKRMKQLKELSKLNPKHPLLQKELPKIMEIKEKLEKYISENTASEASFHERNGNYEFNTQNSSFVELMDRFQYSHKSEGLPKVVWNEAHENFRKGLIDGLFSSDGHVTKGDIKKEIVFSTAHEKMAKDVSELLGFYGIQNSIKKTENESFIRFDVRIRGGASIRHFRDLFTLSVTHKQERLDSYQFPYNMESDKIKVVSVEKTELYEDVWDIGVFDKTHAFQIGHCVTGNCAEIALRPFQFCNLVEVNAGNVEDQKDLEERIKAAAFLATLQAGYTDFHYLRPIWRETTEKDALLGISMTGIGSGRVDNLDLKEAVRKAHDVNMEIAKAIDIEPAARLTCVKPAGTTSLVLGTSSGIHSWFAPYYIRRVRVGKDEAIYKYLQLKLPEYIEDDIFAPDRQAVISIPQSAPESAHFLNESAIEFLDRVRKFYTEWVLPGHIEGMNTHNISATVSLKEHEWDSVGMWMWVNKEYFNGLTVLPVDNHTYQQTPFEEIGASEYAALEGHLKSIDLKEVTEDQDDTKQVDALACAGGNCEII